MFLNILLLSVANLYHIHNIKYPYYYEFNHFIQEYNKTYNSTSEFWYRYNVFVENYQNITSFNSLENSTYYLDMNKYWDFRANGIEVNIKDQCQGIC